MKTACTAFIMILLATSCAKEFSSDESTETDNQYFTNDHTLRATTQSVGSLTFSEQQDFIIPEFIDIRSGEVTNSLVKIYFDYSKESNQYAYFCRYYPSEHLNSLEFDNCFANELTEAQYDSIPRTQTQLVFLPGYLGFINPGNAIILEVFNNMDTSTIEVEAELEIN